MMDVVSLQWEEHLYIQMGPRWFLRAEYWAVESGLVLGLNAASERCRYKVSPSLIGWTLESVLGMAIHVISTLWINTTCWRNVMILTTHH